MGGRTRECAEFESNRKLYHLFCVMFFPVENERDVINIAFFELACEGVGEHDKRHDQAYSFENGPVVGIFTD